MGGSGSDGAYALAISSTGEVYVAGVTNSTNFPRTSGGAQAINADNGYQWDAFVARLNSSLTQILQATYLGGSYWDEAYALAIHPTTGEIYVAGATSSTNFPVTTGGAQTGLGGNFDAFVARLTADLAAGSGSGSGGGSSGGSGSGTGGSSGGSGSGSGGSGTGGSGSGSGGGSGSGTGSSSGGGSGGTGGGGGGGCSMTGSASSMAGLWNILVWLSVPAFVLARRIRKK